MNALKQQRAGHAEHLKRTALLNQNKGPAGPTFCCQHDASGKLSPIHVFYHFALRNILFLLSEVTRDLNFIYLHFESHQNNWSSSYLAEAEPKD